MVNIKHILIGWGKKLGILPTSEAEAALSALRLRICAACDEHKVSSVLTFINDEEADYVDTIFCTKCKCPCSAKTIVVGEHCPIKQW